MRQSIKIVLTIAIGVAAACSSVPRADGGERDMIRLLTTKQCPRCDLRGADLVHANLSGADLQGALLIGANLSRADLSHADLRGSDLRQASLFGTNLANSKLTGSLMAGADLREADLSGAVIVTKKQPKETNQLNTEDGTKTNRRSIQAHNDGYAAYQASQLVMAELYFSEAIRMNPNQAQSWVARSIVRTRLGEYEGAKTDLVEAYKIAQDAQNHEGSVSIKKAIVELDQRTNPGTKGGKRNELMGAAGGIIGILAPLAMKALSSGLF